MTTAMHADKALSIVSKLYEATPLATMKALVRHLEAVEIWTGERIVSDTDLLGRLIGEPLYVRFFDRSTLGYGKEGPYALYPRGPVPGDTVPFE